MTDVKIFPVRHHGPGSAVRLDSALAQMQPDCIIAEGITPLNDIEVDGMSLTKKLGDRREIRPPFAIMIYSEPESDDFNAKGVTVFMPMTEFSPEYRLLVYAFENDIEVRFMDLPPDAEIDNSSVIDYLPETIASMSEADRNIALGWTEIIAKSGGYRSFDDYLENEIESNLNDPERFNHFTRLIYSIRKDLPPQDNPYAMAREAHMRLSIQQAIDEGYQRIAVVCGAWHAPALNMSNKNKLIAPVKKQLTLDREMLSAITYSGKPKYTVVPWTYTRMQENFYGAGVAAPRYYEMVYEHGKKVAAGEALEDGGGAMASIVVSLAAHARDHGIDASTAQAIDTVRLVHTMLASFTDSRAPQMQDIIDAFRASVNVPDEIMGKIVRDAMIGYRIGEVTADVPNAQIHADFNARCEYLGVQFTEKTQEISLDMRNFALRNGEEVEIDILTSQFFEQLYILDIGIVNPVKRRTRGGVLETWEIVYTDEMHLRLVQLTTYGSTIPDAAVGIIRARLNSPDFDLELMVQVLASVINAGLPGVAGDLIRRIESESTVSNDLDGIVAVIDQMVRVAVYGGYYLIEGNDLIDIVRRLIRRVIVSVYKPAVMGISEKIEERRIEQTHMLIGAIDTLNASQEFKMLDGEVAVPVEDEDGNEEEVIVCSIVLEWWMMVNSLLDNDAMSYRINGLLWRHMMDSGLIWVDEVEGRMKYISTGQGKIKDQVGFINGLIDGDSKKLVNEFERAIDGIGNQISIMHIIISWLISLSEDDFKRILPVLAESIRNFPNDDLKRISEIINTKDLT